MDENRLDAMKKLESLRQTSNEMEIQKDESHGQNDPGSTIRQ
jgi:hypothetical protein